jgi:phenylacetate-CoA ligase
MPLIDDKLATAVQHAYDHATAVRQRFDAAGITPTDIRTVADLPKLPVFSKDSLIELQQANPPFGGLLAVPLRELRHIFMSPGPIYEPDGGEEGWASAILAFQRAGFTADDIVINALSYHLVPAGLALDNALTTMGVTVVPTGVGNTDLQIKICQDLGVTGYVGTPSFLLTLLKRAREQGIQLHINKALTSAEPLPPALRQTLAQEYGVHILNAYATAELGVLAVNDDGGMAMDLMPEPIIEIVNPETGQPVASGEAGEVVVTNFSRVYPLIRLGTGDLAMNIDPAPGQSQQTERKLMLVGRSGEAIKVRGMFVHPNQLRFAAAQVGMMLGLPSLQVQGVVSRPEARDVLTVRVAGVPAEKEKAVQGALPTAVQAACRVQLDELLFVPEIGANERGMVDERVWG